MKTYGPFTVVGWFNLILAQWLFFRLAYSDEAWYILVWPIPTTGWESRYTFIGGKSNMIRICSRGWS